MTSIRALPSTPYVQPTAAKPGSAALASAAAADFPTVMRDHHQKLMAPMEPKGPAKSAPKPDSLATMSRRPDIEAMIERQHAARKASSTSPSTEGTKTCRSASGAERTDGVELACADEDDSFHRREHHEDPLAVRADPCGNALAYGVMAECVPRTPAAAPFTNYVIWHPFEAARTSTSTSRALPRRRRKPASADTHRLDGRQAEVDDGAI